MTWQTLFTLRTNRNRRLRKELRPASRPNRRRAFFEPLEERRVLATISLSTAGGQGGGLDAQFSGDGKAIANFIGNQTARDMAIQADGKIVVVGSTANIGSFSDFAVARFNADGSLDTTFGTGGLFTHDFAGGNDDAHAVVIQADGKIVVVGNARNMSGNYGDFDFGVLRLTRTGALDATFNPNGAVPGLLLTDFGSSEQGRDVVIQPDGKIVVVGHGLTGSAFAMARYHSADGSLDSTFSGDGMLVHDQGFSSEALEAVALQSDGKIVAAGWVSGTVDAVALIRVLADGALDAAPGSFGSGGVKIDDIGTGVSENIQGLVLHSGNIVVAGTDTFNGDVLLAGYTSSGSRNLSFGTGGVLLTDLGGNESGLAIAVTGDNKLIVAGGANLPGENFLVARYTASGSLDGTFGSGGIVTTDFGDVETATAVAIDADGKIVAAGSVIGDGEDFGLARYLPVGSGGEPVIDGFEGDAYTLSGTFNDSQVGAGHSIVIEWGDGTSTTLGSGHIVGSGQFEVTHTFADDSSLVTAKIVETLNPATVVASDTADATIGNVAPVADPIDAPLLAVRQFAVSFAGSFSDAGTLDTHLVAWDFGDGTQIPFQPSTNPGALNPTHTYTTLGSHTVTMTVRDDDLGQDAVTHQIVVVGAAQLPAPGGGTALFVGGSPAGESIVLNDAGGGALNAWIDLVDLGTFSPTTRLIVNAGGGDDIVVAFGSVPAIIDGGDGNDLLKGAGGHDILLGGAGDDLLVGCGGRDLLIGGVGADRIVGSNEDDILVAGRTDHDQDAAALLQILAEWTSSRSYSQRVQNLTNGCAGDGLNGTTYLSCGTVHDDGVRDVLTGASGFDWFFANLSLDGDDDSPTKDKITGLSSEEFAEDIDFLALA